MIKSASVVAEQQGHNNLAMRKTTEAQAAAQGPPNEVAGKAAASQIEKMNAQEPAPFDRSKFKAALLKEIDSKTPKTLGGMQEFKKSGQTANIKGAVTSQVQEGKEAAQGPIKQEAEKDPDPSSAQPKPVAPLPPTDAGPAPPDIGAEQATPKPKTQSEVSLAEGTRELDQTLADAAVTEEQLANSNEPEFQSALESKKNVQTHSVEAPDAYRKDEAAILSQTKTQSVDSAATQIQQMHGAREQQFSGIVDQQLNIMDVDAIKREEVASHLYAIYEESKAQVTARLEALDKEVNNIFDKGAEQARQTFDDFVDDAVFRFKLERYLDNPLQWVADLFSPPHEDLNSFYRQGRENYVKDMDAVIDQVALAVEAGLNEAKGMIAAGLQQVQEHVSRLEPGLQAIAMEEAAKIQKNFDTLRQSVDQKHDQLVSSLAQKYVENLQKVDDRIEEMKRENRGLLDQAADALGGVIKTILELKEMLLGVLARAGDVIETIIKDPITFVGNLANGVKAGLQNFVANIGTHLQKGFMNWLFGTLAKAGIQMPESLDLKGILTLVMQVLGLTYANIRARAVGILGEKVVVALEQAFEIFKILITEGPPGLWRYIKEKVEDLKTMVIEGIKSFVIEKVVVAGVTWIVSLLNPASAFVKAAKAIYDIIMFFVNRGSQIMDLVNAVLDSVSAIASGAIGVAASAVENALARAIPVAIGFLASLLGLGDISEKISGFVKKGQALVNVGIDFVINKAVQWVKAAGKMLFGIGKEKKGKEKDTPDKRTEEQKNDDLNAALQEIQKLQDQGETRQSIKTSLPSIQKQYSLQSIELIVVEDSYHIEASINPGGRTLNAQLLSKEEQAALDATAKSEANLIKTDDKARNAWSNPIEYLRVRKGKYMEEVGKFTLERYAREKGYSLYRNAYIQLYDENGAPVGGMGPEVDALLVGPTSIEIADIATKYGDISPGRQRENLSFFHRKDLLRVQPQTLGKIFGHLPGPGKKYPEILSKIRSIGAVVSGEKMTLEEFQSRFPLVTPVSVVSLNTVPESGPIEPGRLTIGTMAGISEHQLIQLIVEAIEKHL